MVVFKAEVVLTMLGGNKPNMQVLMATPENICDTNWYPDSGASNHVIANANNLVQHTPYHGNEQVHVGNVYSNLWGPTPVQSSTGYKYYICFVDAISRISCPHTHQQNGVVERKHRHIVENALTLLARASMPFKYWDESFRIVVFLHNRPPSPVSQAPRAWFEKLYEALVGLVYIY
ncbi:Retrovirus-related Pol polyprotein from transposon RE2 [Vitis vinifera]|uniref:Retrovirus-related Pol polyprotein from transposon RE2 n=1 Tax=Vitis vinifera TaxID=29760 RepID=A0A438HNZ8_VITVI|nr:Retrovirus-related Pol polyprotein from transposon RE2 [Vitis vinifera]